MQARDPQFRTRCLIYAGLALITLALYLPAITRISWNTMTSNMSRTTPAYRPV